MCRFRFIPLAALLIATLSCAGCNNSTGPTGMRPKLTAEMTKSLRVGSSPQQVEGALGAPKTKKPNPSNGNQQLWDYGNGSLAIFGNEQLLRLQIEGKDLLAPPGAAASATPK